MKKRIISALVAILLIASAVSMAACGQDTYSQLADKGYTLKVNYDVGGADVGGKKITTIVEVFNPDQAISVDGKSGFYLLPLDSDDRDSSDVIYELEKYDNNKKYFLVGWYRERTPRVDENGQALDCYGLPVSETGREQGYIYSGLWDFENDLLSPEEFDENGDFYLYAAWAPRFTYEIYVMNENGEFDLETSLYQLKLEYPDIEKGRMKDYPEISGKTFNAAYLDEEMTSLITGNIDMTETYMDFEKGINTSTVIKIYATYSVNETE